MLRKLRERQHQEGFTIIEVLIVLAIAGLIMVVVFLAVPNLERSQRNNARKTDANNILEDLSEYVGNADGSLPGTACTGLSACSWISYNPQQLTNVNYYTTFASAPTTAPSSNTAYLIGGAVARPTCWCLRRAQVHVTMLSGMALKAAPGPSVPQARNRM